MVDLGSSKDTSWQIKVRETKKGYSGFSPRIKLQIDVFYKSTNGILNQHTLSVQAGSWVNLKCSPNKSVKVTGMVIMGEPEELPKYRVGFLEVPTVFKIWLFPNASLEPLKKKKTCSFEINFWFTKI